MAWPQNFATQLVIQHHIIEYGCHVDRIIYDFNHHHGHLTVFWIFSSTARLAGSCRWITVHHGIRACAIHSTQGTSHLPHSLPFLEVYARNRSRTPVALRPTPAAVPSPAKVGATLPVLVCADVSGASLWAAFAYWSVSVFRPAVLRGGATMAVRGED